MRCEQEAATGRVLGVEATRGAVHNMFLSLLWRLAALRDTEAPDRHELEALAAARSTFTGQLEAILETTDLVSLTWPWASTPLVTSIRTLSMEHAKQIWRTSPARQTSGVVLLRLS